eukprot:scaffold129951_cov19-Tisochrysis_lutea.AAC.4
MSTVSEADACPMCGMSRVECWFTHGTCKQHCHKALPSLQSAKFMRARASACTHTYARTHTHAHSLILPGFGTAAMIATGCIMARVCHTNNCPVGVATQREELRARFPGAPEDLVNYFHFVAEEVGQGLCFLEF